MAATLDRISGGRLLINVVTGGDPVEIKGDGIFLDHDDPLCRHGRVPGDVWRGCWRARRSFEGKHLTVEDGRLLLPPVQRPYPPLYFGGSSDAGMRSRRALRHVPDLGRATDAGRGRRSGPPTSRGRSAAASCASASACTSSCGRPRRKPGRGRAADRACRRRDDRSGPGDLRADGLVGQQRMRRLHGGSRDKLEISPNLWAGVGLVRGGAGTALVGDSETVAERMREYMALGIDTFISPATRTWRRPTASPSWSSRTCRSRRAARPRARCISNEGPFGEIVANERRLLERPALAGAIMSVSLAIRLSQRAVPWSVPAGPAGRLADRGRRRGALGRVLPAPSDVAVSAGWEVMVGRAGGGRGDQRPAGPDRARHRRQSASSSACSTPFPAASVCSTAPCRWCATSRTWP